MRTSKQILSFAFAEQGVSQQNADHCLIMSLSTQLCKAKRQYMPTCKLRRYCHLAHVYGSTNLNLTGNL